jgi:hypothetical protein
MCDIRTLVFILLKAAWLNGVQAQGRTCTMCAMETNWEGQRMLPNSALETARSGLWLCITACRGQEPKEMTPWVDKLRHLLIDHG